MWGKKEAYFASDLSVDPRPARRAIQRFRRLRGDIARNTPRRNPSPMRDHGVVGHRNATSGFPLGSGTLLPDILKVQPLLV